MQWSWRHPYGPRLCNITDFYHYAMHPLKNFYHTTEWGPALSNAGPDHNTLAAELRTYSIVLGNRRKNRDISVDLPTA